MLFWPKLLCTALAITSSVHAFLPLYFVHFLNYDYLFIANMLSVTYLCRIGTGFWCALVDVRPTLHGVIAALLTAVSTAALVLILSIPLPYQTWLVTLICTIIHGLTYQPLTVVIDSAILKILGDYRILYDSQRQWGNAASGFMMIGIGWLLVDDHDFDTLMGTTLIGSMALFLLSLSTTVQPADPSLLAVPEVQAPLMKNALQPVESRTSNHFYKPYSLFGEQLSHISEEDASMLQRMSSQQRPTSLASRLSYGSRTTTAGFAYYIDYPWIAASRTPITRTSTTPNNGPECQPIVLPSLELALLPLSSCEAPMAVLMTLWPPLRFPPDEEELIYSYPIAVSAATQYSLILSMALLGMAWAMMNSFLFLYLYDSLHLPMYTVGIIGAVTAVTDTLAKASSMRLTRRFNVNLMIGLLHLDIILCAFIYTWLQPDHMATQIAALVLQIVQTLAFHLIWLIAYQQVDDILFVNEQRMFLRGVMSALYASLGPAMGVLVVGLLVNEDVKADMALQGFQSVYQSVVGLVAFSSVVSWGWTSSLSV